MIPFNKPYLSGNELAYIQDAVNRGHLSGNGYYTKKCHSFFEEKYQFNKCLLTTSCTDALEMSAILIDIKPGDEVIMPSFTFVSTANAFVLRGAKIVFADSKPNHPNIDETKIESLITPNTKAIVVVHYTGVACEMDSIMALAEKHNIFVIEDAAHAIDSKYKGIPLGGIGHLATFSFHETKNIHCGEGGMLVINDNQFADRAEIIWEKGTNRSAFFKGDVDKYGWVDLGSSFLPSELNAAYLYAQIEEIENIQALRKEAWELYKKLLSPLAKEGKLNLPEIGKDATNNAHVFYVITKDIKERDLLIAHLKKHGKHSVFHYLPLHLSPFFENKYEGDILSNAIHFSECLMRLPLFPSLERGTIQAICLHINEFYHS